MLLLQDGPRENEIFSFPHNRTKGSKVVSRVACVRQPKVLTVQVFGENNAKQSNKNVLTVDKTTRCHF